MGGDIAPLPADSASQPNAASGLHLLPDSYGVRAVGFYDDSAGTSHA